MTVRAGKTSSPIKRRARKGLERVKELAARFVEEGMSEEDAMSRAYRELRDNTKGDWRRNPERKPSKPVGVRKKKKAAKPK